MESSLWQINFSFSTYTTNLRKFNNFRELVGEFLASGLI